MKDAAVHFGDTGAALHRSDKLINAKVAEFEELVQSAGEEKGLIHIYSGVVHVGVVEQVKARSVVLSEPGKKVELKIENIRLMSADELERWKNANLTFRTRDISVFIPEGASPGTLCRILEKMCQGTVCEIIDTYEGFEKGTSVTFRLIVRRDFDIGAMTMQAEKLLEDVGCFLR
jgi:prephenate dehydrogenase